MNLANPALKIQFRWEWQSNANPWSTTEKPQWTLYSPIESSLLEQAYSDNEMQIDLGNYFVFIMEKDHDMFQQSKTDMYKQRRVRRTEVYDHDLEDIKMEKQEDVDLLRKKRFYGAEVPKTYNKTFGGLKHFLQFFENRGPEIKAFANMFREIESSQDFNRLNYEVLPRLVESIEQESVKIQNNDGKKMIIKLFQGTFTSFQQFYGDILKAYTIEGFLYRNVNKYLRSEDWSQLDCLLPYAFCLCKAFVYLEMTSAHNPNQNQLENVDPKNDKKILLYRGAGLDEIALSFYELGSISNFSWNAVTSTSSNQDVADSFMNMNADKNKIPVMFVIEIPQDPESLANPGWIDLKPFSDYPDEDEVVLSPGSVFKLVDFRRDKKSAEVHLRLITDVATLSQQGQIMHGAMHAEMAAEGIGKVVCLEKGELAEALGHLSGNHLVEELELTLCKFNGDALKKLVDVLPTIPKLTKGSCFSLASEDKTHLNIIIKALSKQKIKSLEVSDKLLEDTQYVIPFAMALQDFTSLTSLSINFAASNGITDEEINQLCSKGLGLLTSLTSLSLNFEGCTKITDGGLYYLCLKGIKNLASLKSLTLNLESCTGITDLGLSAICSHGIIHLTELTTLNLSLKLCKAISDNGLCMLVFQGRKCLASLTSFTLNLEWCYKITERGLTCLFSQGLMNNTNLTSLNLGFAGSYITDEGWDFLSSEGFRSLSSLTALTLCFESCKIENESLFCLAQGIRDLDLLKSLSLDFRLCSEITDEALSLFSSEGIRHLNSLTSLDINFSDCWSISDTGMRDLCYEGMSYLTKLTTLGFNFKNCHVSRQGLSCLFAQEMNYLDSLATLALNLDNCITYQGISHLCSEGLEQFVALKTLSLYAELSHEDWKKLEEQVEKSKVRLEWIDQKADEYSIYRMPSYERVLINQIPRDKKAISENALISPENKTILESEVELEDFCVEAAELGQLHACKSLYLDSEHMRSKFTDDFFIYFTSCAIQPLTSLTTLNFNFDGCHYLTDEGFIYFCSQGIKEMPQLLTLKLTFFNCPNITGESLDSLWSEGIRLLSSLATLQLSFGNSGPITDETFKNFCQDGDKYLDSLKNLDLLIRCDQLNDENLKDLSRGIKNLKKLTTLKSAIGYNSTITDQGFSYFCSNGIKNLTSLKSLSLALRGGVCTDEALKAFSVVQDLSSLTELNLEITNCLSITDKGVTYLTQGIQGLVSLTALSFSFKGHEKVTDEGLGYLCTHSLKHLPLLSTLNLNFEACDITDKGLEYLCFQAMKYLTLLTSLTLNFNYCKRITNAGLKTLCCDGFKYLTSLSNLDLSIGYCEEITDEGLNYLCFNGIKGLPALTRMKPFFQDCSQISNAGLRDLSMVLKYFGFRPQLARDPVD